jgi:DNA-binding transcriptional LysR family regulator
VIPYFLSGFLQKYTGVDLVLDVTNKTRVISSLKNNEIDFALVSSLPNDIEINEAKLLENKLYLVSGPEENSNRQLLIFREEGSATRVAMDTYFSKVQTRKRLELTSNEAVKQAVMAGLGQSLLPLIGIRNELLNHQIRIIPSKDLPIVSSWRLIWLKKKKCSPVAEAYLNFVEKNREEIVAKSFKWYLDFDERHFT